MSKRSKLIQEEKNFKSKLDKIDEELKKRPLVKKDVQILTSNWEPCSIGEFNYRYYIKNLGVTFNDTADVNIHITSLKNANNIASSCETTTLYGGSVILYATEKPIIAIDVDVLIHKSEVI